MPAGRYSGLGDRRLYLEVLRLMFHKYNGNSFITGYRYIFVVAKEVGVLE